jgi:hypothetical protein
VEFVVDNVAGFPLPIYSTNFHTHVSYGAGTMSLSDPEHTGYRKGRRAKGEYKKGDEVEDK